MTKKTTNTELRSQLHKTYYDLLMIVDALKPLAETINDDLIRNAIKENSKSRARIH